jgi:hypothetical protein
MLIQTPTNTGRFANVKFEPGFEPKALRGAATDGSAPIGIRRMRAVRSNCLFFPRVGQASLDEVAKA